MTRKFPLVSVVFLAVVGLIAAAAYFFHKTGDDTPTSESTPPATTQGPIVAGPSGEVGPCGLPRSAFGTPTTDMAGKRVEVPINAAGVACPQSPQSTAGLPDNGRITAPAGLIWQQIGGIAVPFSTDSGPTTINDDGVPSGFAHTPQGALLAAMQIDALALADVSSRTHIALMRQRVVATPEQLDAWIRQYERSDEHALPKEARGRIGVIPGVRVTSYAPDFAHVEWISPLGKGYLISAQDMVWADADWKLSTRPDNANPANNATKVAVMDGSWSPW